MDFVTWDSIKDLRGTTYVQPPTRFRFALQQAQHAILRAIIHNNPTSPASESARKALVLSRWLLLGRPAVSASESNCAHFLDARFELFWAEDWSALWAMVRAECVLLRRRTRRAERTSSRCSHVFAKSLHQRVLVKKDEPWQLPEMHRQFQSQNKLFKRSRASILRTQNHPLLYKPHCQPYSCLKWPSMSLSHSERCHDSVNHLACVQNIGMTLAPWRETVTCLCK